MRLFDSHCHFDAEEFDADRAAVLARARAAGVVEQVVPAVDAQGWPKLRAVCADDEGLHPAYGLHPLCLANHRPEHLAQLAEWVEREHPCAIGECGLDFHVEGLDAQAQREYFVAQLHVARDFDLPLVLHARKAVEEVIHTLRRVGGLRGVVHSWSGSEEQARQLFELGFHLGVGGPVTYERANRLRGIVARMPLERLLLETDAPDQPLSTHRGQRNEPARMVEVARVVASLRGMAPEELAAATTGNARALFGLAPVHQQS
jgi:TatD DNase family protein